MVALAKDAQRILEGTMENSTDTLKVRSVHRDGKDCIVVLKNAAALDVSFQGKDWQLTINWVRNCFINKLHLVASESKYQSRSCGNSPENVPIVIIE